MTNETMALLRSRFTLFLLLVLTASGCVPPDGPDPEEMGSDDDDSTADIPNPTDFDLAEIESGIHETAVRYLVGGRAESITRRTDEPPGFDVPYDTQFATRMRRINEGAYGNHIYSQLQAFSTDNEYVLMTEGADPDSVGMVVKRLSDLEPVMTSPGIGAWQVAKWHPSDFHKIVHFDGEAAGVVLQITDVDAQSTESVFTFPDEYTEVMTNQTFDEISRDGRWFGGMALTDGGSDARIFAFDLESLSLEVEMSIADLYDGPCAGSALELDPDWVGVSPLGRYLVVQWASPDPGRCNGMETFDLETGEFVGRVTYEHPHGDLQVLADGVTEVFVSLDLFAPGPDESYVGGEPGGTAAELDSPAFAYRVLPGDPLDEAEPNFLILTDWILEHLSCRGPFGWCLVTAADNSANGAWDPLEEELFLLKLDGSGVVRLGHHRSDPFLQPTDDDFYWAQPRASFSSDGRYVIFDTNWGVDPATSAFVIDLAVVP